MIVKSEKTLKLYRGSGLCEWCGIWLPRREANHVLHRGMGGGTRLDLPSNLTSLCPHFTGNDCHRRFGNDPRCYDRFYEIIARREGFESGQAVLAYLQMILQLPKGSVIPAPPTCPF